MRSTKNMAVYAMLSAMAYVAMFFIRLPIMGAAPFLKYDPKDIIIVIGGFLFGPLAAAAVSMVVSFAEMVTVSESGPIGMLMNILASVSFACTAAMIYKLKRNLLGAVMGLVAGCLLATGAMLLWNYIVTPMYMGVPRQVVTGMLIPVFLPFNLLKTGLNGAFALLLYKPVVNALRKSGLYAVNESNGKINKGLMLAAGFAIISIVLVIMVLRDII